MSRRYEKEKNTIAPEEASPVESTLGDGAVVESGTDDADTGTGTVSEPPAALGDAGSAETEAGGKTMKGEPGAGTNLFIVERVPGQPRYTAIRVERSPRATHERFDLGLGRFQVDRDTALAAVRTGAFRIAADSPAKLKEREE